MPKISIVTPSFNQGRYLEETIQSVLSQDYPNLEYMIMDGGSTDESFDILHRYESRLTFWQSSPDGGQYEAINSGFARTDGEIMAWINSDDKYTPWAFSVVAEIFLTFPEIEWITTLYPLTWDAAGRAVACGQRTGYTITAFLKGRNIPGRSHCPEGT
ncbi:MAG: glycosyltransferase, partial [Planctomycetes bacterium]|nr:glycosyltransferase [Planctomycetota bacterium]